MKQRLKVLAMVMSTLGFAGGILGAPAPSAAAIATTSADNSNLAAHPQGVGRLGPTLCVNEELWVDLRGRVCKREFEVFGQVKRVFVNVTLLNVSAGRAYYVHSLTVQGSDYAGDILDVCKGGWLKPAQEYSCSGSSTKSLMHAAQGVFVFNRNSDGGVEIATVKNPRTS
ncbi:hypothetical protein [Kribbella sp. NPDC023855]|uniref:hypothetical protein n=1 Tax=Kribbella sp. NPDC023855 TaxID=3154698 RepID=UPI0033FEF290